MTIISNVDVTLGSIKWGEKRVTFEHGVNPKIIGCSLINGIFRDTLSIVIESTLKKGCELRSNKSELHIVSYSKDFAGPGIGWTYLHTDKKFNYFGKIF